MIKKWKMLPINTEGMQNRYVIYLHSELEDVKELTHQFAHICQDPFEINQDGFNWAFYIVNSAEYERSALEQFLIEKEKGLDTKGSSGKGGEIEDNLRALVEEVKKVIRDLDKKGLTVEELKAIEERTAKQAALKEKETAEAETPMEVKISEEAKSAEYKPGEVSLGYLFPVQEEQKFNIFMNTLAEIEKVTSQKPVGLRKVFAEAYNPFDAGFKLSSIIKMFKNYRIETLVILTPDARMVPKEKDIIEELKKKLKRKVLFKIAPLSAISKRSIYVGLIVDIALFKEKGLDYFRLKP
ncbi:MAG: hypothetical protein V1653_02835 [bacterium]